MSTASPRGLTVITLLCLRDLECPVESHVMIMGDHWVSPWVPSFHRLFTLTTSSSTSCYVHGCLLVLIHGMPLRFSPTQETTIFDLKEKLDKSDTMTLCNTEIGDRDTPLPPIRSWETLE